MGDKQHLIDGDDCTDCGATETVTYSGEQYCTDCAPWSVEQDGLGDEPAQGQTTLDGGISKGETDG